MFKSLSAVRPLAAFLIAGVIAATVTLGQPTPVSAHKLLSGAGGILSLVAHSPVRSVLDGLAGPQAVSYGSDGRLTILLLGSDTRSGGISRTDTIMVMSLKGNQINVASIPRDTWKIPNYLTSSPSDHFRGRVNTIARQIGLANFQYVIEKLLNIEIDYYALVSFKAFEKLVDVVDPIVINNGRTIKDKGFWDDPDYRRGVYFPASSSYYLYALPDGPLCNGLWRNYSKPPYSTSCHRALPYVRSRKGAGNNDFMRARRQQNFVGAAIRTVTSGDVSPLVNVANAQVGAGALMTNIPFNSSAFGLYDDLNNAYLANQVVFAPKKYAKRTPGTSAYQLNLTAVRAWTATYMK